MNNLYSKLVLMQFKVSSLINEDDESEVNVSVAARTVTW